jgi:hypothetical protein
MDTLPPLLPPGCQLQGRRTLHLDLDRVLAHLGVEESGETRVGVVVMALEAARHYGLSVAMGGDPHVPPAGRMEQAVLNLECASGTLLELVQVPGVPGEAQRLAATASPWIAAASSLIPAATVGQALRLRAVACAVARRLAGLRRSPGRRSPATPAT